MNQMTPDELSSAIGTNLPYLRRYARALTGSRERGDGYAVAALEAILEAPGEIGDDVRTGLFKVFHGIWASSGGTIEPDGDGADRISRAQARLAPLTAGTREALLLHTVEEFDVPEVAAILSTSPGEAKDLIDIAFREMSSQVRGKIMIIEDEAIIAMDIEAIVQEMGHDVTGIARTEAEAVDLAKVDTPDLVLSDIQLADNSSGIDAVNRIVARLPEVPVIFITAFPERLLTGEGPEPAFLISKPYSEDQVRSAVSQAMFFASTETLRT
jgi:CheY-like chemotaxis protein